MWLGLGLHTDSAVRLSLSNTLQAHTHTHTNYSFFLLHSSRSLFLSYRSFALILLPALPFSFTFRQHGDKKLSPFFFFFHLAKRGHSFYSPSKEDFVGKKKPFPLKMTYNLVNWTSSFNFPFQQCCEKLFEAACRFLQFFAFFFLLSIHFNIR